MLVGLRLFFPIEKVRRRDGELGKLRQLRFPHDDDSPRLRVIERLEQDRVHDREDGGASANPEREGENGDGGEAGRFQELAKGVADVV